MNKKQAIEKAEKLHVGNRIQYHVVAIKNKVKVVHDGKRQDMLIGRKIKHEDVIYSTKHMFDHTIEFIGQTPINEVMISSKLHQNSKPSTFFLEETNKDLMDTLIDLMENMTDGSVIPSIVEIILPTGERFEFFSESDLC